jgi:hypothetical protein
MGKIYFKKGIVIGIILLFFGATLSSAISVETKPNTSIGLRNERCECNEISSSNLIKLKKQLNKLEIYTKLLLILSKENQGINKKCQELLNCISKTNINDDTIMCNFLEKIFNILGPLQFFLSNWVYEKIPNRLGWLLGIFVYGIFIPPVLLVWYTADFLGCDWIPRPPLFLHE